MPGKKRSKWKPPFFPEYLMKKINKLQEEGKSNNLGKLYCRSATIIPNMVGMSVMLHNGKKFIQIKISPEMVGYKLGDFVATRVKCVHDKSAKKAKRG